MLSTTYKTYADYKKGCELGHVARQLIDYVLRAEDDATNLAYICIHLITLAAIGWVHAGYFVYRTGQRLGSYWYSQGVVQFRAACERHCDACVWTYDTVTSIVERLNTYRSKACMYHYMACTVIAATVSERVYHRPLEF